MSAYEDMFRPDHELIAVIGWVISIVMLVLLRPPFWYIIIIFSSFMLFLRMKELKRLWMFRLSLSVQRLRTILIDDLIEKSRFMRKKRKSLYLGRGFIWSQKHAEIADQIMNRDSDEMPDIPNFVKKAIEKVNSIPPDERHFGYKALAAILNGIMPPQSKPVTDSAIGLPWIHGIGASEDADIALPIDSLSGHTLITGTTRAGKTRLYEMLTAQIIDMGSALIVIDPKKDNDWVSRLKKECKRKNRKFLYFDIARPSESIRINPLANFNNVSEVATRIGQLVDADGSFAAFAWKTLVRVQRGLIAAGEKPNIKNTKYYVQMGVDSLAQKVIEKFLLERLGPEYDRDINNQPAPAASPSGPKGQKGGGALTRLELLIVLYEKQCVVNDAIDGLIAMFRHSKEHFSKMIQVLEPILEMLGSDEIGEMLAPDPSNTNDKRPIYDMRKIIDEKAVLYVGLDSLSNKIIASAIGSILLADLSSTLGSIYNFSTPSDLYLFVDEGAEVANDQLIQVLNKGGGAGAKVFLAVQAIADLIVRFQSKDKAEQMLANLNNIISLRVRSLDAAQYVSDMFGEVKTRSMETSVSTGSESSSSFTEFKSSVSKKLKVEKNALVSPSLLTRLPPLHYFAFISGRNYLKGSLEFITDK